MVCLKISIFPNTGKIEWHKCCIQALTTKTFKL